MSYAPVPTSYDDEEAPFVWTTQRQRTTTWVSAGTAIASLSTLAVVHTMIVLLLRRPHTRQPLRRQSFRMLFAVLAASIPYSIAFLVESLLEGPSRWCPASIFFGFLTQNFINFMIMLLSVNLQLVFVHGLRTEGFSKWYILGSFLLSLVIIIPGTVKNIWGWDPVTGICYVQLINPTERTAWQVATGYFWTLLSTVIAFICTVIVIGHLIARRSRRELVFSQSGTSRVSNENIFRSAAWRIVTYPIVMIIYNAICAASDLSLDQREGITSFPEYALWTTYGFVYGSLPWIYSLLVLFVDPSFTVALRDMLRQTSSSGTEELSMSSHHPNIRIHLTPSKAALGEGGEELRDLGALRPKRSLADVKTSHHDFQESDTESTHNVHPISKVPSAPARVSNEIGTVRREFEERRQQARCDLRTRLQAQLEQM